MGSQERAKEALEKIREGGSEASAIRGLALAVLTIAEILWETRK